MSRGPSKRTPKMRGRDPLDQNPHWLDAAHMLREAANCLLKAHDLQVGMPTDTPLTSQAMQRYLNSAIDNINAALARFDADRIKR